MPIPVVLAVGSADVDLDVEIDAPADAPIGDLLAALAGGAVEPGTRLLVDGRRVAPDATVADACIRAGSVLRMVGVDADGARHGVVAAVELWVTGGLQSGQHHALPAGSYVVGRAPSADVQIAAPGVSGRHARLDVTDAGSACIADLRSHLGVSTNG